MNEKIKNNKQLAVELRNKIAFRLIEAKANLLYWKKIVRQCRSNSPEIIEALKKKQINEDAIKADIVFLKCIDEMIKGGIY